MVYWCNDYISLTSTFKSTPEITFKVLLVYFGKYLFPGTTRNEILINCIGEYPSTRAYTGVLALVLATILNQVFEWIVQNSACCNNVALITCSDYCTSDAGRHRLE